LWLEVDSLLTLKVWFLVKKEPTQLRYKIISLLRKYSSSHVIAIDDIESVVEPIDYNTTFFIKVTSKFSKAIPT